MTYQLYHGDCLEILPQIADNSIDAVICDPPYGTTACKWDSVIPFEPMWTQLKRIIKPRGAIVLFGSQPFTSALVMSNPKWFKYALVWDKVNLYTGSLLANIQPLKRHEDIIIFCDGVPTYNKQYRVGQAYSMKRNTKGVGEYTSKSYQRTKTVNTGNHNPCSIIEIEGGNKGEKGLHPTQKPLALLEYLVKTYTNEGDTVLDFTMGSGTTGHACVNTGRNYIGIEKDAGYFEIGKRRIEEAADPLARMVA